MAYSILDLIAQAAVKATTDPISSFDDGSVDAQVWATIWQPVLQRCLDDGVFNFNTVTVPLSRLTAAPTDPRYSYAFQLPGDFSTSQTVMDEALRPYHHGWEIQGQTLMAHRDTLWLRYSRQITLDDVPNLPSHIAPYYVAALGYEANQKLTGKSSNTQRLSAEVNAAKKLAFQAEARNQPAQSAGTASSWLRARFNGR